MPPFQSRGKKRYRGMQTCLAALALACSFSSGGLVAQGRLIDRSNSTTSLMLVSQFGESAQDSLEYLDPFIVEHEDLDFIYLWNTRNEQKEEIYHLLSLKNGPDVVEWYAGGEVSRSMIRNGLLLDLHEIMERNDLYEKIPPNILQNVQGSNGHPYMLPTDYYHWGLYFNVELLEELDILPPESFDEFIKACKKVKEKGLLPISIGAEFHWPLFGWFDYLNMRLNGPMFHAEVVQGKVKFTDPRIEKVFELWKQLLDEGYFPSAEVVLGNDWEIAQVDLLTKKAAFTLMGDFIRRNLDAKYESKLDFVQFPIINASVGIGEDAPTDGVLISANAKSLEAAEALLVFMSSEMFQRARLNDTSIPSNLNVIQHIQDPKTIRGAEMLAAADYTFQFFDRDMKPALVSHAKEYFAKFYRAPETYKTILEEFELSRQEIYLGYAAKPEISPGSGRFSNAVQVTMSCFTENATIYYTLDGSTPSPTSSEYTSPIMLYEHGTATIKAIAARKDLKTSELATSSFFLDVHVYVGYSYAAKAAIAAGICGEIYCFLLLAFVVRYWKTSVMRAASPAFLVAMIFGSMTSIASLFSMSLEIGENSRFELVSSLCMVSMWLMNTGFSISFSALLMKTYRIVKLFSVATLTNRRRSLRLTNMHLALGVLGMVIFDSVVLMLWTIEDPQKLEKEMIGLNEYTYRCTSRSSFWSWLALSYKVFLTVCAMLLSFFTRNYISEFNESRGIMFAVYNVGFFGTFTLTMSNAVKEPNASLFIIIFGLLITNIMTISSVILPKFFYLSASTLITTSYAPTTKDGSGSGLHRRRISSTNLGTSRRLYPTEHQQSDMSEF